MSAQPVTLPSAQMLQDIAMGLEDPATIAFRYGYEAEEYSWLADQDWFLRSIEQRKADLRNSGWTYKAKMAMLAEDCGIDIYKKFKTTESLATQVDIWKYFNKLADLEPKQNAPALVQGNGFSITINLGDKAVTPESTVIDMPQSDSLPPMATYLRTLPFESLNLLD